MFFFTFYIRAQNFSNLDAIIRNFLQIWGGPLKTHFNLSLQQFWSKDHTVRRFNYESLLSDDTALLSWLVEMETKGATLLTDVPADPNSANNLANYFGFHRQTIFGYVAYLFVKKGQYTFIIIKFVIE